MNKIMADEPTIAPGEAELLSQEEDLRAKQESGENLEDEEKNTLTKIDTLHKDLKERFKGEKETPEQTEAKKQIASLQAQKQHFRNKFGKESGKVKDLERQIEELKKQPPKKEDTEDDKKWREKIDFKTDNPGQYSSEEIDFIETIAKGKGISLSEAAKRDEVKTYIKARRDKEAKDKKVPTPSSRTARIQKKFKVEKMTEDEHRAKYKEMAREAIRAGRKKSQT